MSCTFGHETANVDTSKTIYRQSWSDVVNDSSKQGRLVVTGYSCRSQVKRIDGDGQQLPHPLQLLNQKSAHRAITKITDTKEEEVEARSEIKG